MADNVNVNPTPIQRNQRDVAMELTKLYFDRQGREEFTIDKIKEVYINFYSVAKTIEYVPYQSNFNPTVEKLAKDIISGE
jgi:hypothetical protein